MTTTTRITSGNNSRNFFVGNKVPRGVCRKTLCRRALLLGENHHRTVVMMMMMKKISTRVERRNERSRFGCVRVAAAARSSYSGSSNDDDDVRK